MVIRQNNYLSVPAHARLTYDLRGNELLAYGLIHGFSQDGSSWYEGGQQYIADWCGISRRGVRDVLSRLVSIGAIERQEVVVNNVTFCKYRAILTEEETSAGDGKKLPQGTEESSHNNIEYKVGGNMVDSSPRIINNTSENISTGLKENKKKEFDLGFVNIAFLETFNRWLAYKRGRGQSYKTQESLETCYRNLLKYSHNDPHTAQLIIDEAIGNNYAGFFELKQSKQQSYGNNSTQAQQPRNRFVDLAAAIKGAGGIL